MIAPIIIFLVFIAVVWAIRSRAEDMAQDDPTNCRNDVN
jgi:hypothetical protein